MNEVYVDPDRQTGSQSEVPIVWYDGKYICFDGYQRFCLAADGGIWLGKQEHKKKYGMIRPYLKAMVAHTESIIDLGCSAGVMGFQAYIDGYRKLVFVDHDSEYLGLVQQGLNHLGAEGPIIERRKVQEIDSSADTMFVFALVHWLYSCTEDFGSLEGIVAELAMHCRQTMFIEWVGPDCDVIQDFGHTSRNPELHKEEYTRDNFIRALRLHYPHVALVGTVRKGREIWVASTRPVTRNSLGAFAERIDFWRWRLRSRFARWFGPSK